MEKIISVIVPVYKVEPYIKQCVDSILAQTFKAYELILIDDGSPDLCPQICDEYAQKHPEIRVIHKENCGLSEARNTGIMNATGKYVTFIDSDDYVGKEYLSILYNSILKFKADLSFIGMKIVDDFSKEVMPPKTLKEFSLTRLQALENMLYQKDIDTSACAILIPTKIARKFLFPARKYHEDEFTTYKYIMAAKRVAINTSKHYYYVQRNGSIMHTLGQSSVDELEAADNLVTVFENNCPQLFKAANSKKFSDYCQVLLSSKNIKKEDPETYQKIVNYLMKMRFQIIFNKNTRLKNKTAAIALCGGINVLKFIDGVLELYKKALKIYKGVLN